MCKNCYKAVYKQESGGWNRLVCENDIEGTGVSGFYNCIEFVDKCLKCVHRNVLTYETPCFLCGSLYLKPYYVEEVSEND